MVDSLTSLTSALSPAGSSSTQSRNQLSREDFMGILISEMTNQDPMEPLDNQEFLAQLVQLENLEATSALTASIESLAVMQQLSAASSLIGRTVTVLDGENGLLTGVVEKVSVQGGQSYLMVDGRRFGMDTVSEIQA